MTGVQTCALPICEIDRRKREKDPAERDEMERQEGRRGVIDGDGTGTLRERALDAFSRSVGVKLMNK